MYINLRYFHCREHVRDNYIVSLTHKLASSWELYNIPIMHASYRVASTVFIYLFHSHFRSNPAHKNSCLELYKSLHFCTEIYTQLYKPETLPIIHSYNWYLPVSQSFPVQPGTQEQLFGAIQVPPFLHGDLHTAV